MFPPETEAIPLSQNSQQWGSRDVTGYSVSWEKKTKQNKGKKPKFGSLEPQKPCRDQEAVQAAYNSSFNHCDGDPQSKRAVETSIVCELWAALKQGAEEQPGRFPSTLASAHTH